MVGTMAKVMGIDEAGRGAVIGPMVICGVVVEESNIEKLKEIGVKDSKELTPRKREELAEKIEELVEDIIVLKISPCKIDTNRMNGINLNLLEAKKMAEIIKMANAQKVVMDAPGLNTERFKKTVESFLDGKDVEIVAENFADKKYPVVSAASIIAKVERDKSIEELKKEVGFDFGVGYSHDKRTIQFLEMLVEKHGKDLPPYVRKTWDTTQQIINKKAQSSLLSFLKRFLPRKTN